ncbi:MAG: BPTI/Kunitz domain-containing protein [Leptospiraceae bacterium]|nr:BPTI/Kunitz domain-containing protein [Leptospiraceae bacterium]
MLKSLKESSIILVLVVLAATTSQCCTADDPIQNLDASRCSLKPNPGPCRALMVRYFYNPDSQRCQSFNWGGCQGSVPFETLDACQASCETKN